VSPFDNYRDRRFTVQATTGTGYRTTFPARSVRAARADCAALAIWTSGVSRLLDPPGVSCVRP